MTRCDRSPNAGRGRGTAKPTVFSPVEIKSEEERKEELISERSEIERSAVPRPLSDDPADLASFLASHPAMTARDWKGKGFHRFAPFDKDYVAPGEVPWHKLDRDFVRRLAITTKARFLSRNERMAAGRDPGLIWDERTRSYRLRLGTTPPPPLAIGRAAEGGGA
jgi:hypothetical protein